MFVRAFIQSKTVRRVGYDFASRELEIKFTNGHIYHYKDVPVKVVTAFVKSQSKGEFFNHHIRNDYESELQPDA